MGGNMKRLSLSIFFILICEIAFAIPSDFTGDYKGEISTHEFSKRKVVVHVREVQTSPTEKIILGTLTIAGSDGKFSSGLNYRFTQSFYNPLVESLTLTLVDQVSVGHGDAMVFFELQNSATNQLHGILTSNLVDPNGNLYEGEAWLTPS
jgi:hypothetical protein